MKHFLFSLKILLCFVFLNSCGINEQEDLKERSENSDNEIEISISVQLSGRTGDIDSEKSIHLLRLMIFDKSGDLIINKLFNDASGDLGQLNGTYRILERIPRNLEKINVCLIANEPSFWRLNRNNNDPDGLVNYKRLKNKVIDYERDYPGAVHGDLNQFLDIDIENSGIVMFAEKALQIADDGSHPELSLDLVRRMAKITLTLSYDLQNIAGVNLSSGDTFVLRYATIEHQPVLSFLTPVEYDSDNNPLLSSAHKMLNVLVQTPEVFKSYPVVFYIPEHILSEASFRNNVFTAVSIVGEYTPSGGNPVIISYQVPLGDGMQKKFSDPLYTPVKQDYSISGNHHYVIDGTIRNLGAKDGFHVSLQIKPWEDDVLVDIKPETPFLNVSDIYLQKVLPASPVECIDNIFYWSNQPQDRIAVEQINIRYFDKQGDELTALQDDGYNLTINKVPYMPAGSGHIELNLKVENVLWSTMELSFYLKAGNLKRKIKVDYLIDNPDI